MDIIKNNESTNMYLLTLLDPQNVTGIPVPDNDMTTSHPKKVGLAASVTAPATGKMLFWYRPHARTTTAVVKYYVWSTTNNAYDYVADIAMDEDITQSYNLMRFVSGCMDFKCSTIAGGIYPIQGIFNAVQYQELPDLRTLNFQTLTSYKRNAVDVLSGESVTPGIRAKAHPNGDHSYSPFDTNAVWSTGATLNLSDIQLDLPGGTGSTFFSRVAVPDGGNILLSSNYPAGLPPNFMGKGWINFTFTATATAATLQYIRIRAWYPLCNPALGTSTLTYPVDVRLYVDIPAGATGTVTGRYWADLPTPIVGFQVLNNTGTILTPVSGFLNWENEEYYQEGFLGPGTLVAVDGFLPQSSGPSAQIVVSGCANYEVVPNASLSRQITTGYRVAGENINDMLVAEAFLSQSDRFDVRMLNTIEADNRLMATGRFNALSDKTFLGQASGFTDFLSNIWNNVAPVLKGVLPAVGSLFGERGSNLGKALGDFIPDGDSSVYRRGTAARYGRAADFGGGMSRTIFSSDTTESDDMCDMHRNQALDSSGETSCFHCPPQYYGEESCPPQYYGEGSCPPQYYGEDSPYCPPQAFDSEESSNESGEASLLGGAEYSNDVAAMRADPEFVVTSADIPESTVRLTGSLPGGSTASVRSALRSGVGSGLRVPVQNTFPIRLADGTHVGRVTAWREPLAVVGAAKFMVIRSYGGELFMTANTNVAEDAVMSVALAFTRFQVDIGTSQPLYLAIDASVDFSGGSLGAAAFCSLMGWPIDGPITGAVGTSGLFLANNTQEKAASINKIGKSLFVVLEPSDFKNTDLASLAALQAMGRVVDASKGLADDIIYVTGLGSLAMFAMMDMPRHRAGMNYDFNTFTDAKTEAQTLAFTKKAVAPPAPDVEGVDNELPAMMALAEEMQEVKFPGAANFSQGVVKLGIQLRAVPKNPGSINKTINALRNSKNSYEEWKIAQDKKGKPSAAKVRPIFVSQGGFNLPKKTSKPRPSGGQGPAETVNLSSFFS